MKWIPKNMRYDINKGIIDKKIYSQNGEDGIIEAIFSKIGTTNKFAVEFGIDEYEGNTKLLKKQGWNCLWMDGNGDGNKIKKEFITAENINDLFRKYNVPEEFDLLSIDIDGNDLWIWKAIENYKPRVVVIEYNSSISVNESKTVKYDPELTWDGSDYYGASLLALKKLGIIKGYTLIACDSNGVNAFFLRNDVIENKFEVRDIVDIYKRPNYGKKIDGKHTGHPTSERKMIDF